MSSSVSKALPILDLAAALAARDEALERVEKSHTAWINTARTVARRIAESYGTVTADDVREVLYRIDYRPKHYNAWGAVFRHPDFVFTGRYKRSAVPGGKGNMQRVWCVWLDRPAEED